MAKLHEAEFSPAPLSSEEQTRCTEVARRLCTQLRALMEWLPDNERGGSAMSRVLDIDRNTCQRILSASTRTEIDSHTLVQLPGVVGIKSFINAICVRFAPRKNDPLIATAMTSVEQLQHLVDDLGGSQRKLKDRIDLDPPTSDNLPPTKKKDDPGARRALFLAAAQVTGRFSETNLCVEIVRPVPGEVEKLEASRVRGWIGHVSRTTAATLEIDSFFSGPVTSHEISNGISDPVTSLGAALLAPFCTHPLPKVNTRSVGKRLIREIDSAEALRREALDIVIADSPLPPHPHPSTCHPPLEEIWSVISFPTRRLIFDVYLQKDLARRCLPSLEVLLHSPHAGQRHMWQWATPLPNPPKIELLGPGSDRAHTSAYPRHTELTQHLFRKHYLDPRDFVGYRCEVAYPIWHAAYSMVFDFSKSDSPNGRTH